MSAAYFELGMKLPLGDIFSLSQGKSHQRGDREKGDVSRPNQEHGLCGNGSKKPNPDRHVRQPKNPYQPKQPK
jgi:hypothetical protein